MTSLSLLPSAAAVRDALPPGPYDARVVKVVPLAVVIPAFGTRHEWLAGVIPGGMAPTVGEQVVVLVTDSSVVWVLPAVESPAHDAGDIKASARATAPAGWLLCNGASLLRADYADLFSAIGTTYGSADGTHFTIPNLLGRFPMGADPSNLSTATGHTVHALGASGGEETHILTTPEIPAHGHQQIMGFGAGAGARPQWNGTTNADYGDGQTGDTGGGGAHNNLPPFVAVNWLIKT